MRRQRGFYGYIMCVLNPFILYADGKLTKYGSAVLSSIPPQNWSEETKHVFCLYRDRYLNQYDQDWTVTVLVTEIIPILKKNPELSDLRRIAAELMTPIITEFSIGKRLNFVGSTVLFDCIEYNEDGNGCVESLGIHCVHESDFRKLLELIDVDAF